MKLLTEFKTFAMKGNVIDLAAGIIIGTAFGTIVASLVGDILMPIFGILTGGINFSNLSYTFGQANIAYGKFIQAIFVFTIVAFALFIVVKALNAIKREKESSVPQLTKEEELLTEIRDILKKN
ncbi:MAG: large conductance mechanosensitive channel protein MscL [Chlorobiaceae bacterium]|nr:large conductance mechanosensitive channel protein MscL [Chlorobiaceae bacterium]MBA4310782.1 large conductance mechanosensitive channel protein MscL [Chlorobiaceae bacterium]